MCWRPDLSLQVTLPSLTLTKGDGMGCSPQLHTCDRQRQQKEPQREAVPQQEITGGSHCGENIFKNFRYSGQPRILN